MTRRHSLRTVPCLNHDELLADVLLRESSVGSAAKLIAALSCNLAGVDDRWVFVPSNFILDAHLGFLISSVHRACVCLGVLFQQTLF